MQDEDLIFSRTRRLKKKRKNNRWIIVLVGILLIFILSIISAPIIANLMYSDPGTNEEGMDDPTALDQENDESERSDIMPTDDEEDEPTDRPNTEADGDLSPKTPDDYELTFVESTEENVVSSYTADWQPILTVQEEPHTISFEKDSTDWKEMLQAATLATGIDAENMQYLWVSGNGPGKVITTYTDRLSSENFRVHIEWRENQGYTPTQVDMLYSHDQMNRFSSNSNSDNDQENITEVDETN